MTLEQRGGTIGMMSAGQILRTMTALDVEERKVLVLTMQDSDRRHCVVAMGLDLQVEIQSTYTFRSSYNPIQSDPIQLQFIPSQSNPATIHYNPIQSSCAPIESNPI